LDISFQVELEPLTVTPLPPVEIEPNVPIPRLDKPGMFDVFKDAFWLAAFVASVIL